MGTLEKGSTSGGYTILTTADLPNIVAKSGASSDSGGTNAGKFVKVATAKVTSQYAETLMTLSVVSGNAGGVQYQSGKIFFRIKQQNAMGTAPYVNVVLRDPVGMGASDVIAVLSQNDTSATVVDLYVKVIYTYDVLRYKVDDIAFSYLMTIYQNAGAFLTSVPTGLAQYTCVLSDGTFNNLTMGGKTVINTDHTSASDPHTQYVRKTPYVTTNTSSTGGQYALIGTVTITAQFQMAEALISFMGGANGNSSNIQRGLLYFRAKQQNAMASAPYIEMYLMSNNNFSPLDVVAITTSNTGAQTVIQLYVKINSTFEELSFNPIHELNLGFRSAVNIVWSNQSALIATSGSLPAGTQTTALFQPTNTNGTTANRPTSGLHVGMQYFDTTLNKPIWRNTANTGWVDATGTTV
jgi:hypothetical protein